MLGNANDMIVILVAIMLRAMACVSIRYVACLDLVTLLILALLTFRNSMTEED